MINKLLLRAVHQGMVFRIDKHYFTMVNTTTSEEIYSSTYGIRDLIMNNLIVRDEWLNSMIMLTWIVVFEVFKRKKVKSSN